VSRNVLFQNEICTDIYCIIARIRYYSRWTI